MSGIMELIKVGNNNPGTAPDYTENDVITLRRYNGEPLNHTQADDNLELLRRALIAAGDGLTNLDDRVTNVLTNLEEYITGDFIQNLFNNQVFENLINEYITENITNFVSQFFNDNRSFNVDGRVFNNFQEYIESIVSNNFNNYFDTYLTEYGDQFFESINLQTFVDDSINQYFEDPPDIFVDQVISVTENIVQEIDIESLLNRLQTYIDNSIHPINLRLDNLDQTLQAIFDLLENLDIGDGTVDLSSILKRITTAENKLAGFLGGACYTDGDGVQQCEFDDQPGQFNSFPSVATLAQENKQRLDDLDIAFNDIVDAINEIGQGLQDLADAVSTGFQELENWITGVFKDIMDSIVDLGEQIENNANQIVDLWTSYGDLAQALWNQIGFLWAELGTAFTKLEELEKILCELELRAAQVVAWCNAIGEVNMTFCEDGEEVSENFAIFPAAMANLDPEPAVADLAACGGPVFQGLVAAGKLKAKDANKLGNDAKTLNREKNREMKRFVRAANPRQALNQAVNKGFSLPTISKFIHAKLTI
tara:strand:- start:607 stop:2217 length:1611 start_codon:yes stop_codon:yes gene_type:complete